MGLPLKCRFTASSSLAIDRLAILDFPQCSERVLSRYGRPRKRKGVLPFKAKLF
jgi:hypothetical protein